MNRVARMRACIIITGLPRSRCSLAMTKGCLCWRTGLLLPGPRGLHPPTKTDVFAGPRPRDDSFFLICALNIKNHPLGGFCFVVFVSGGPRHIKCLRGNRNDLTARCWSNLLLVEPALFHNAWYRPSTPRNKTKTTRWVVFVLLVGVTGFEPATSTSRT